MNKLQQAGAIALLDQVKPLDSMRLAARYREVYGEPIDWHDTAWLLDKLWQDGELVTSGGYFPQYAAIYTEAKEK